MAAGDTQITIAGNLVDDPELRFTPAGQPVARFRVASTPRFRDNSTGEWKDGDSLFLTCNVWRQAAEHVAESLTRGTRVIVSGRLRQRSYETKEGEKRTVYEVEVDDVGPSLRNASAKVNKVARNGSAPAAPGGSGGRPSGGRVMRRPGSRGRRGRRSVVVRRPRRLHRRTPVLSTPAAPGAQPADHERSHPPGDRHALGPPRRSSAAGRRSDPGHVLRLGRQRSRRIRLLRLAGRPRDGGVRCQRPQIVRPGRGQDLGPKVLCGKAKCPWPGRTPVQMIERTMACHLGTRKGGP